jgi:hypothetical protein
MAYSKGNAESLGPRFDDYLEALREEFELLSNPTSTKTSRPSLFNIYLGGLKGEFQLMTVEIESLQREKGELESLSNIFLFLSWKYFTQPYRDSRGY